MLKCKVCGKEFEAKSENHYIVRCNVSKGLFASLAVEENIYDAFDCPHCGCQFVAQERKREFVIDKEEAKAEETDDDKPFCFGDFEEEADDCEYCKFVHECAIECNKEKEKIVQKTVKVPAIKHKKPGCFGNFGGYGSGYCDECNYYKGCKYKTSNKQNDSKEKQ